MLSFRPNVAALIINSEGKLLVCERSKQKGAWQFPQGGVDKGEKPLDTLFREVLEEVGLAPENYEATEYIAGYKYFFPKDKAKKKGFIGQKQTYFRCLLNADAPEPNVSYMSDEFRDYKWIKPKNFKRKWLPEWKNSVYESVMWDFFGVKLDDD